MEKEVGTYTFPFILPQNGAGPRAQTLWGRLYLGVLGNGMINFVGEDKKIFTQAISKAG